MGAKCQLGLTHYFDSYYLTIGLSQLFVRPECAFVQIRRYRNTTD